MYYDHHVADGTCESHPTVWELIYIKSNLNFQLIERGILVIRYNLFHSNFGKREIENIILVLFNFSYFMIFVWLSVTKMSLDRGARVTQRVRVTTPVRLTTQTSKAEAHPMKHYIQRILHFQKPKEKK